MNTVKLFRINMIENTLKLIKDQIGVELELDTYFTGIREYLGQQYFNVKLKDPVFCSNIYSQLLRLADFGILRRVEVNGYKRLAIYPKINDGYVQN